MFSTFIFPTTYTSSGGGVVEEPTSTEVTGFTIESDAFDVNLYTLLKGEHGDSLDGYSTVNVVIDEGVVIGSKLSSTTNYALDTGTGWGAGVTLTLTNNGFITGRGGDGGDYDESSPTNGGDGSSGIIFRQDWTLINGTTGVIQGGGGGGGGGTNEVEVGAVGEQSTFYSNGGGGAGADVGAAGGGYDVTAGAQGATRGFRTNGGSTIQGTNGGAGGGPGADGSAGDGTTGGTAGNAYNKGGNTVGVTNNGRVSGDIVA